MEQVRIEFVETPIDVRVDMSLLTWGDLIKLQKASGGNVTEEVAEEMINTIISKVTGQNAADMPAIVVGRVLAAIQERAQANGQAAKN